MSSMALLELEEMQFNSQENADFVLLPIWTPRKYNTLHTTPLYIMLKTTSKQFTRTFCNSQMSCRFLISNSPRTENNTLMQFFSVLPGVAQVIKT